LKQKYSTLYAGAHTHSSTRSILALFSGCHKNDSEINFKHTMYKKLL